MASRTHHLSISTPTDWHIAWGIDDNSKTPYSHVVDFSLTRDLGHNFVLEATYTGRFARHLLQKLTYRSSSTLSILDK